ncbi:MAG: hypothetical protein Q8P81_04715 [Nanoarchaeota archaeon]|nr:hypothetical protein [Nanoarchaeota archaeon]
MAVKKGTSVEEDMKKKPNAKKSAMGKKSRAAGARFESKVRAEIESLGWIVSKWTNTVDYDREGGIGKIVPAKRKYNPFLKALGIGVGFPDFVCFKRKKGEDYEVIGLEVKANGYLDQIEKGMCYWFIENKVFSKILIAKKGKTRGKIEYVDFEERYASQ